MATDSTSKSGRASAQPMRVEFTFRMPVVEPSTIKPLDGVLSHYAVKQAMWQGAHDPLQPQWDIGVARYGGGGDASDPDQWCLQASNIEFEWRGLTQYGHRLRWQRYEDYYAVFESGLYRAKPDRAPTRPPAFDGARGDTKAALIVEPLRECVKATAWAIVDDSDRFEFLCHCVSHIGKYAHNDMGAVATVALHRDEAAWQNWRRRPLPLGAQDDAALAASLPLTHAKGVTALRSPYWKRTQQHVAWLPKAQVG